jgi:hypothetical protein
MEPREVAVGLRDLAELLTEKILTDSRLPRGLSRLASSMDA